VCVRCIVAASVWPGWLELACCCANCACCCGCSALMQLWPRLAIRGAVSPAAQMCFVLACGRRQAGACAVCCGAADCRHNLRAVRAAMTLGGCMMNQRSNWRIEAHNHTASHQGIMSDGRRVTVPLVSPHARLSKHHCGLGVVWVTVHARGTKHHCACAADASAPDSWAVSCPGAQACAAASRRCWWQCCCRLQQQGSLALRMQQQQRHADGS
jgi:hypothetical protein